jgi:hypothetical protein
VHFHISTFADYARKSKNAENFLRMQRRKLELVKIEGQVEKDKKMPHL